MGVFRNWKWSVFTLNWNLALNPENNHEPGLAFVTLGSETCWIKFWKKQLGGVLAFSFGFLTCSLRSDWILNILQFMDSVPFYTHVCGCHMVYSVPNELLTSCQLPMQIKEAAIEGWLYPELRSTSLECYEINHSCLNSCLYPCVSCHVWVFFHYNTYHVRKALWEF